MTSLYAIMEDDGSGEKFFNGLLRAGNYNKTYKLAVYKNKKVAENRLEEIQNDYQRWIDKEGYRYNADYRVIGATYIKEFVSE